VAKKLDYRRERLVTLLRRVRTDAGLTQADLAARLGKNQASVSRYESGLRQLDILEVLDVCQAAGIEFEEFARMLEKAVE
jgi:transcriptional regulator with XRE-family HTH domain